MSEPWEDRTELEYFIDVIKELSDPHNDGWNWFDDISKKYIDIRVDMRNGDFILKDRDGNRISLDDLKNHGDKNET